MGLTTDKRIALYTAAFAGAALFACPAMTAAAVGGAALGAVGSLAGNTLASDVHAAFTSGKLDSLHNHHLQQLVGRALAVLITFYEKETRELPSGASKWIPFLRRDDADLTTLAKAAETHWHTLALDGGSEKLYDDRIQEVFSDHDRSAADPYIAVNEWDRHLADLSLHAQSRAGDFVFLREDKRRALAEYIAPRFAAAVRELVKADLDPNTGTGGRVFVALHLDLMRTMAVSLRAIETKSDAQLEQLKQIKDGFDALRKEIGNKLSDSERDDYELLLEDVLREIEATGKVLVGKIDALHHDVRITVTNTEVIKDRQEEDRKERAEMKAMLAKLVAGTPGGAPADASVQTDLVAAVERVARDAARGGMTARNVLEGQRPDDVALYLRARRDQLELAQRALNDRVDEEKRKLDREFAAVAYVTGRIDEAKAALERLLAADPADLDAINRLGHIYQLRGDLVAAEGQYRRLLDLDATEPVRAVALGNIGTVAQTRGDLDAAERYCNESLAIYRELGRLEGQANQLGNLGTVAQTRGDLDAAERYCNESLTIDRKLGRLGGQASSLGNLGILARIRGDLDAAKRYHNESLAIERKLGRLEGQASQLGNLGTVAQIRGDLDAAERYYNESLAIYRKLGRLDGQASQLGNLGTVAQTRGDLDAAERYCNESLAIDRKLGRLEGQANQLGNLGNVAQIRGDFDAAERCYNESLVIDRKFGRLEGQASTLGNLGLVARSRGDLDAAERYHNESLAIERKLGRLEGQAGTLGNLGSVAKQRGNIAEARRLWTESRDLYARIGVPHMVAQLQSWLDRLPPG